MKQNLCCTLDPEYLCDNCDQDICADCHNRHVFECIQGVAI